MEPKGRDLQFDAGLLYLQLHQFCSHLPRFDRQPSHAHRQFEAARARAAGIEVEDAVFLFHFRLMAVAVDRPRGIPRLPASDRVGRDRAACRWTRRRLRRLRFRAERAPSAGVDVAADRGHGRDLRERLENFRERRRRRRGGCGRIRAEPRRLRGAAGRECRRLRRGSLVLWSLVSRFKFAHIARSPGACLELAEGGRPYVVS